MRYIVYSIKIVSKKPVWIAVTLGAVLELLLQFVAETISLPDFGLYRLWRECSSLEKCQNRLNTPSVASFEALRA